MLAPYLISLSAPQCIRDQQEEICSPPGVNQRQSKAEGSLLYRPILVDSPRRSQRKDHLFPAASRILDRFHIAFQEGALSAIGKKYRHHVGCGADDLAFSRLWDIDLSANAERGL